MKLKENILVISIIICFGFYFHFKYINEFPNHIHAWAQADRYALALGFVNNNLNFFKPETYVQNHQFPNDYKVPTNSSITAVDFPIHDYMPALFMKITGNNSVWIFKLYVLLFSFIGLYYLFRLSYLVSRHYILSVFVIVFAALSPVFIYYQGGFLPTIPSLSTAFVGIYFYSKYLINNNNKHFNQSLFFLTLSTLSRTTFAIPLIALFGFEVLRLVKNQSKLLPKILPVMLSVILIITYFFYNNYLRNTYGSMFLNEFLPAKSFHHAKNIIQTTIKNWKTEYFSWFHYLVFLIIGVISIPLFFRNKNLPKITSQFFLLTLIILTGCILFAILMLCQFPAHDYYFLDSFFLPVLTLLIVLISAIPKAKNKKTSLFQIAVICLLSIPMFVHAKEIQKSRHENNYWDPIDKTVKNFTGSKAFLDSIHVADTAKILAIGTHAPNIPFILLSRKGFVVLSVNKTNIKKALKWDYDYIVVQNEFFYSDIYPKYPEFLSRVKKIADNGQITVCKYHEKDTTDNPFKFLGLSNRPVVLKSELSFDTVLPKNWSKINYDSTFSFSGEKSGLITPETTFSLEFKKKRIHELTHQNKVVHVSSYVSADLKNDCHIVVSVKEKEKDFYYKSYNIKSLLKTSGKWEKVDLLFYLPQLKHEENEFTLYFWNSGQGKFNVDNFSIKIY